MLLRECERRLGDGYSGRGLRESLFSVRSGLSVWWTGSWLGERARHVSQLGLVAKCSVFWSLCCLGLVCLRCEIRGGSGCKAVGGSLRPYFSRRCWCITAVPDASARKRASCLSGLPATNHTEAEKPDRCTGRPTKSRFGG